MVSSLVPYGNVRVTNRAMGEWDRLSFLSLFMSVRARVIVAHDDDLDAPRLFAKEPQLLN